MEAFATIVLSRILPSALAIVFVGMTLVTSGMAGMKLLNVEGKEKNDANSQSIPVPTLAIVEGHEQQTGASTAEGTQTVATRVKTTTTSGPTGVRVFPTAVPVVASTTPASVSNLNACIVTLFGKQYDVSRLRSTHSGGDIFTCGTDMTSVYQGKHGTNVNRMQSYAVSTAGSTGSTGASSATGTIGRSGATGTSTSITRHDDDDDDSEDEKNYIKERRDDEKEDQKDDE